jgi:hypothetical protein
VLVAFLFRTIVTMFPAKKKQRNDPSNEPTKSKVVKVLCGPPETVSKPFVTKDNKTVQKDFFVTECPRRNCHKGKHKITWPVGAGYSNPFSVLCTCYGSKEELLRLFREAEEASDGNKESILDHFQKNSVFTPYEMAVHSWIDAIVAKSLPLNVVECDIMRRYWCYDVKIGVNKIKAILFAMVELVEGAIAAEMKAAGCGALMHDAWTKMDVHYIGIFACYMREVKSKENGKDVIRKEPTSSLISVAPMASISRDGTVSDDDASRFNAQTMKEHINSILPYYEVDEGTWNKAVIADNAQVNIKLCDLLGKPHIGCRNHLLALDVKDAIASSALIDKVTDAMLSIKGSLKNTALLRKFSRLKAKIACKPRWSSTVQMLDRFLKLFEDLQRVADEDDSNFEFNFSPNEISACERLVGWMKQVDVVTVSMQKHCLPLYKCDEMCKALNEICEKGKRRPSRVGGVDNVWKDCGFKVKKALTTYTRLCNNPNFINGVCKIQKGQWNSLSDDEEAACEQLLNDNIDNRHDEIQDEEPPASPDIAAKLDRIRERPKTSAQESPYIDCDFIFGSAAQVEQLWSIARYILTTQRSSLTPLLFETLLFLKVNNRFWSQETVVEAIAMAK